MTNDGLGEEEGEGYFASVSDLMVGVLFVFLLMLTVFALNFRDDSAQLDELKAQWQRAEQAASVARAEADRDAALARQRADEAVRLRAQNEALLQRLDEAAEALKQEVTGREAARENLLQRLASGLEDRGVQFVLDQRSGVLHLSDAVPFDTQKSDLTDTGRRTVTALAEVLAQALPCFAQGTAATDCGGAGPILEAVLVEGHTDRQAYRGLTAAQSQSENDRLSTARALTVFAELRRLQPSLEALHNPADQPLLGVSGYGERRPLPSALTLSDADLAQNRRIDLRFVLSSRTSDELRRLLDQISALQKGARP